MIKISKIVQTCGGCPAQWDAWDSDGRYIFIRYRHGGLSVDYGNSNDTMDEILYKNHGGPWDGCMTFDELKEATKESLDFGDVAESDGKDDRVLDTT